MPQGKSFQWFPHSLRNPYILNLHSSNDTSIVFNGYFYMESDALPVERVILTQDDEWHHIQIVGKECGDSTSSYEYDEEEDYTMCLFPTEVITLTYRILQRNLSDEDIRSIIYRITCDEEEEEEEKMRALAANHAQLTNKNQH